MVKHYNTSISEDAARILNSKQGQFLSDDVQGPIATIAIEPKCNIIKSTTCSNATSATIFTTPADKDFYLTAVCLSTVQDATSTNTRSQIQINVDGVTGAIVTLSFITLTAGRGEIFVSLDKPVKLDRNSAVRITHTTAVANCTSNASAIGYTVETTK